ncbi:ferrous iron transporter B [Ammonifex thiophilus]|uniref:Ferrous iron transporter B n=1 Tax=Ammonifex thiophilus TaxID=444093 RepID=A0A3D8P5Z5_9THEO|nr:ferrous iron transporter B [Ammonifex thiophilus]RDV83937.1 ferrous iron transporter B [Ammonifex thiophilus]
MNETITVALVGSPNVGKSTLFNTLTGSYQQVGNWPGKTVEKKEGFCRFGGFTFRLVDLPGTYSLNARSAEEEVARNFLLSGSPDVVVVLVDATCLTRHLYLALQVIELTPKVVLAVNFLEAARDKGMTLDLAHLSRLLNLPVVPVNARSGKGGKALLAAALAVARGAFSPRPQLGYDPYAQLDYPALARTRYQWADHLVKEIVCRNREPGRKDLTSLLDQLFLHPVFSFPLMGLVVVALFWLSVNAGGPLTELLARLFSWLGREAAYLLKACSAPVWLESMVVEGLIAGVGAVISVMLPTMTIFFFLFAFLEDAGFIPRLALVSDPLFRRVGAQGKHCVTSLVGLGCNVPGVMACRILEGKDRLIGIITNSFVPCNGRLGIVLPLASVFFGPKAIWVVLALLTLSFVALLLSFFVLSRFLPGPSPVFFLELPPYRWPNLPFLVKRTFRDRVVRVLSRAVWVAAPMVLAAYWASNFYLGEATLTAHLARWLAPVGELLGMDGSIMVAFLYALPAKETFIGALAMIQGFSSTYAEDEAFIEHLAQAIPPCTAFNLLLFFLLYSPCLYTLWVIHQETRSWRYLFLSLLLPLTAAFIFTFIARLVESRIS